MRFLLFLSIPLLLFSSTAFAQIHNNWRGPERDGKFHETQLLKQWPDSGPVMRWSFEGLGRGFTSAIPANGNIYVTGMEGDVGFVYELSMQGQLLRKFSYGDEMGGNYPGSRSTPTIAGNLMYLATGVGKLVCMDLESGTKTWERDLFGEFDGSNIQWGFTENLIVDGDVVYCSPGGKKNNIVALNRFNGRLIWTSPGKGDLSAYCSPLLIDHHGKKIFVNMMNDYIIGLDAGTGKLLWSHPYANQRSIHPNAPIYHDGSLYCFSGYGFGGVKLTLNTQGTAVTEEWFNSDLDNQMGGAVIVNGYIYGSGNRNRNWYCIDWKSGETVHESRDIDIGTVIYADGLLYAYTQRGELALLEPQPGRFRIISKTSVELGSDQHWAHLVIHEGILYVRHGNALMAYEVKAI
jgi:outer membrane protein assembly factor BamB